MRVILIVLDSVGVGAAPDAADYGDAGANTLGHLAQAVGGIRLPTLERLGLGNIPPLLPSGLPIEGVSAVKDSVASFAAMQEHSRGKDTTTGHWEIAGLLLSDGFRLFPQDGPAFPTALLASFQARTGRAAIGNRAASGTAIIEELGPCQIDTGAWIVYTSADSVFQVAAHENIIPLHELYQGCQTARELCNAHRIGRVIARPYAGKPGGFRRTENRRDYSYPLPEPTILDILCEHGVEVTAVGKLDDVFDHSGMTESIHVENNPDAQAAVLELLDSGREGLIFANYIDFDMLYGHRRNPAGYASCLEEADEHLGRVLQSLRAGDVLIITADHGNDPTFRGTDHTREYVPLLVHRPGVASKSLGIRQGFFDIAQSLAACFDVGPMPRGVSFL